MVFGLFASVGESGKRRPPRERFSAYLFGFARFRFDCGPAIDFNFRYIQDATEHIQESLKFGCLFGAHAFYDNPADKRNQKWMLSKYKENS